MNKLNEPKGTCPLCGTNAVVLRAPDGVCADCMETRTVSILPTNKATEDLDEILARHRSETWSTGWNNEATEAAKAAILSKYIKKSDVLKAIGENTNLEPLMTRENRNQRIKEAGKNELRAEIKQALGLGE